MSKMAHFLYVLLIEGKNKVSVLTKYLMHLEDFFSSFRKYYRLLGSELPLAICQQLIVQDFSIILLTLQFFILKPQIPQERLCPKPINHTVFYKNLIIRYSRCTYICCPNCE